MTFTVAQQESVLNKAGKMEMVLENVLLGWLRLVFFHNVGEICVLKDGHLVEMLFCAFLKYLGKKAYRGVIIGL